MTPDEARDRFASARVARLATVGALGAPRLVPVTFALLTPDVVVTAVDHKPKTTVRLRRLDDISAEPRVALLVDEYDDDWSRLWWARADGLARIADSTDRVHARAVRALSARYAQYREHPPGGPAIVVTVTRWSGWSYS